MFKKIEIRIIKIYTHMLYIILYIHIKHYILNMNLILSEINPHTLVSYIEPTVYPAIKSLPKLNVYGSHSIIQ